MLETNPFDEIEELNGDDEDPKQLRTVTQEGGLCSNPSDGEGASTQPLENLTQKEDTVVILHKH
jgi:hypothetical protein